MAYAERDARSDDGLPQPAWNCGWHAHVCRCVWIIDHSIGAQSTAFIEVVNRGSQALPLLMEKLTDPDQHFALKAVEYILSPEFIPVFGPEDPEALEGEQFRARAVLSNWLLS